MPNIRFQLFTVDHLTNAPYPTSSPTVWAELFLAGIAALSTELTHIMLLRSFILSFHKLSFPGSVACQISAPSCSCSLQQLSPPGETGTQRRSSQRKAVMEVSADSPGFSELSADGLGQRLY